MKLKTTALFFGIPATIFSLIAGNGLAAISGEAAVANANATLKKVEDLWEVAKKGKDMIKFNCVNDQLSTLRGLISVLGSAVANHREAVEKNDKDQIAHEASKISIAQSSIKQAEAKAQSCKGEVARYTGTTEKTSEVDPNQSGAGFTDVTATSNMTSVPTETQTRPNATSPLQ
ncbi:MAG: hypothetical protein HYY84_12440 [Deltaproteobacteria bacterium]|nr:hypothetical protein [Deltaproteobacteria bacterium]